MADIIKLLEPHIGKVLLYIYTGEIHDGVIIRQESETPLTKEVEGANPAEIWEEDWVRLPDGRREFLTERQIDPATGEILKNS